MRHWDGGRKKFDCIGVAFADSLGNKDSPAAVMVGGSSDAPSINFMWCPGPADIGGFVNNDFGARGASGVPLKSNAPFSWTLVESCGFSCKEWRRFKVVVA